MVIEGELAVKLHANSIKVVNRLDRNPRQDKITMGRLTVLEILTTKALVLLGFNIMH